MTSPAPKRKPKPVKRTRLIDVVDQMQAVTAAVIAYATPIDETREQAFTRALKQRGYRITRDRGKK